jgi:hypothetical protein
MLCPLLSSPLGQEYKEDLALSSDLFSKWPLLEDPYEKHFVQVKTNAQTHTCNFWAVTFLEIFTAQINKKESVAPSVVELYEATFIFVVIFLY